MNLIRDILDKQLVDRNGRNLGKIDGLILDARPGRPPRVADLEIGPATFARRFSPKFAERLRKFLVRFSSEGATRIPWESVRDVGVDIELDIEAAQTDALKIEHWLRHKIICRIPGA
jgi:sporulation protein YlmC with PRC-barrel domain